MALKNWQPVIRCSAVIAATLLAVSAYAQQRSFNLPEQEATKSLPEFARQAGVQIAAPSEYLKGMRTPQIKGELDVRKALERLLEGTGLIVASDHKGMIVLQKARGGQETAAAEMDGSGKEERGMSLAKATSAANSGAANSSDADSNASSARSSQTSSGEGMLQEIVVTAQKREERLIDVPQSVTVLSADSLA